MTDKEFLEEKVRRAKEFLSYLVKNYDGPRKEELIDMMLDAINDAREKLKEI